MNQSYPRGVNTKPIADNQYIVLKIYKNLNIY